MYDRASKCVHLFVRGDRRKKLKATIVSLEQTEELQEAIGEGFYKKLLEDIEVLDSLISPPDLDRIQVYNTLYIALVHKALHAISHELCKLYRQGTRRLYFSGPQ